MDIIIQVLINAAALFIGAQILRGVHIEDFIRAIVVAVVIGVINWFVGGFLDFITTPLRWLTLGLFALVIDAIIIKVADYFMKGLKVDNFWWALGLAAVVSVVNAVAGFMGLV